MAGDAFRPFYGFFAWDVGRIWFSGDHLMYAGERARFSVPRAEVTSVQVFDTPGTARRQNSMVVRWRQGVFTMQPIGGASLNAVNRLHDEWIRSAGDPPASLPSQLVPVYPDLPSSHSVAGPAGSRLALLVEAQSS